MIIVLVITVLFLFMISWPFLLGTLFDSKDKIHPLYVKSENAKNPRYFAVSFTSMMDGALAKASPYDTTITLSHEESLVRGDGSPLVGQQLEALVYEDGDLSATDCVFTKEVYVLGDVYLRGTCELRALAARGHVFIDDGSEVVRWLDAEKGVLVGRGCSLGHSLTSKGPIVVGRNSSFQRVFAPMVFAGDDFPSPELLATHPAVRGLLVKEPEFQIDRIEADEVFPHTIITSSSLVLKERCVVQGDIKSERDIRILPGAVVTGGVFADGGIVIESDACVQGDVFSQEDIVIGADAVVGVPGCIRSVIARKNIYVQEGATIYGYIGSEESGHIIDEAMFLQLSSKRY